MNFKFKSKKVTLSLMCLFFTQSCNAQEAPSIIESTLYANEYNDILENVEFEKFLVRYATHYPTATFDSTTKLAEHTLTMLCKDLNTKGTACDVKLKADSIEDLLAEVAIEKLKTKKTTKTSASKIDQFLTTNGVNNIGDKYSRLSHVFFDENAPNNNQSSKLSTNGSELKITTFDGSNGCVDPKHLKNPEAIRHLDLRDNNGGDLKCTLEVLSKFLPLGKHHVATIYTAKGEEELWIDGQLDANSKQKTVMVNKNTASSAEIFTIALGKTGWRIDGLPMMNKRSIQARFDTKFGSYHLTIGRFTSM